MTRPHRGAQRHWYRHCAAALVAIFMAVLLSAQHLAVGQPAGTFSNFQQLGCYNNPTDKKIWIAGISLNPKFNDPQFYDDPNNPFAAIIKAGDQRFNIKSDDILVHPLATFNYSGAEKYQFLKYSLVLDYSSSIPQAQRTDILNFVTEFVGKLPLAVEGQVIRFSDTVEKTPFINKNDIQIKIREPITYGMTALHDALMEAASSLIQEGSSTPVRLIILFTDGYDTSSKNYPDKSAFISSFINLVKQNRIGVIAIGVTKERDDALLSAITDRNAGVMGFYRPVEEYSELSSALGQVEQMIKNTVIFRVPKLGPEHGKLDISIGTETKGGNFNTLQVFNCEF